MSCAWHGNKSLARQIAKESDGPLDLIWRQTFIDVKVGSKADECVLRRTESEPSLPRNRGEQSSLFGAEMAYVEGLAGKLESLWGAASNESTTKESPGCSDEQTSTVSTEMSITLSDARAAVGHDTFPAESPSSRTGSLASIPCSASVFGTGSLMSLPCSASVFGTGSLTSLPCSASVCGTGSLTSLPGSASVFGTGSLTSLPGSASVFGSGSAGMLGKEVCATELVPTGVAASPKWQLPQHSGLQAEPRRQGAGDQEARKLGAAECFQTGAGRLAPPAPPTPAPSPGSVGHPNLCMRPCLYFAAGNCGNGDACDFCHLPHHARPTHLDKKHREMLRDMSPRRRSALLLPVLKQRVLALDTSKETVDALANLAASCGVDDIARLPPLGRQHRMLLSLLRSMSLRLLLLSVGRAFAPLAPDVEALADGLFARLREAAAARAPPRASA